MAHVFFTTLDIGPAKGYKGSPDGESDCGAFCAKLRHLLGQSETPVRQQTPSWEGYVPISGSEVPPVVQRDRDVGSEKVCFLDAPISQVGLSGDTIRRICPAILDSQQVARSIVPRLG